MKKKILYFIIPLFLFFSGISTVFADNCSTVKNKIDSYNLYKDTLSTYDCTDDSDVNNVETCNELNVKKNIVVTELMKLNEENNICSTYRSQVDTIIKENEDKCGKIFNSDFNKFVNNVMALFYIAGPILLILFGSLDYAKATVSAERDAFKKANKNFAKRLAATILLFVAPAITNFIISFNVSDKYLSGNAYTCNYDYIVFNKKYNIVYTPRNNKSTTSSSGTRNGNYILYAQCDPSWGSDRLINSSRNTLCTAGCAVTAVSMQIVNSGVVSENSFSPKVLNKWLQNNTSTGGDISWSAISYGTKGTFKHYSSVHISGSLESKAPKFQEYLSQGYYPVIQAKYGSGGSTHYIAIFEVRGTTIIAGDPAGGNLITLNDVSYPVATQRLDTQVELFTVER